MTDLSIAGVLASVLWLSLAACHQAAIQPESPVSVATDDDSAAWLAAHGSDPFEFTVDLFESADVVLIGESHAVADNCEFVASLIEPLYTRAGVRVLATEFVRTAHNDELEAIVTAPAWDAAGAIDLMRRHPWPTWGYQQYVDILNAAWKLNQSRPNDAEPFRVVGIESDWNQSELLDLGQPERMRLLLSREMHMHATIEQLLAEGERVIAHVGFQHSIFVIPQRLGGRLRATHGGRVHHLVLHHEMIGPSGRSSITDGLDRAFTEADRGPVAFRMDRSPLDELRDPESMHARLLGSNARLSSFIEHYAILATIDELRPAAWIPEFIQDDRLEEAISIGERLNWFEPGAVTTVEEANAAFAARLHRGSESDSKGR